MFASIGGPGKSVEITHFTVLIDAVQATIPKINES